MICLCQSFLKPNNVAHVERDSKQQHVRLQLKKEYYAKGVRDMRQLALEMYPTAIDPSVLRAELLLEPEYHELGCSPVRADEDQ